MPTADRTRAGELRDRARSALRERQNWLQLVRFGIVGASGYLVNLATFTLCVEALGFDHRGAAVGAFLVAVTNNFAWNRQWTFRARDHGQVSHQAPRFLAVSVAAFLLAFVVLEVLVVAAGVPEVPAQAISVLVAMPFNFVGNRLWTFRKRAG